MEGLPVWVPGVGLLEQDPVPDDRVGCGAVVVGAEVARDWGYGAIPG